MKLSWLDATKWAAVAAVVGGVLGMFLSPEQAGRAAAWGDVAQAVGVAVAGAASAFVIAIRKRA